MIVNTNKACKTNLVGKPDSRGTVHSALFILIVIPNSVEEDNAVYGLPVRDEFYSTVRSNRHLTGHLREKAKRKLVGAKHFLDLGVLNAKLLEDNIEVRL